MTGDDRDIPSRRKFISAFGVGAAAALSGCSLLSGDSSSPDENVPTEGGPNQSSGPSFESIKQAHNDARNNISRDVDRVSFEYDRLEFDGEGQAKMVGRTVQTGVADKIIIRPPTDMDPRRLSGLLLASTGAPPDDEFARVTFQESMYTFHGGAGARAYAASTVATVDGVGNLVLLSRGESSEALDAGIDSFNGELLESL